MGGAYRLLTRPEVEAMLAPYACHLVERLHPGFEMWRTGWGTEFVISMEHDGVHYDEWLCIEAIDKTIRPTMPDGWLLGSLADPDAG